MRLTLMTDYALRVLMYAAQQPERLCTIAEVAEAHGISEAHLTKVTHRLALGGWLETVRGKGGGLRLAQLPAAINLGAVVRACEPDFALVECFAADSRCVLTGRCGLAGVLDEALSAFLRSLDGRTLAEVLPRQASIRLPLGRRRPPATERTGARRAASFGATTAGSAVATR